MSIKKKKSDRKRNRVQEPSAGSIKDKKPSTTNQDDVETDGQKSQKRQRINQSLKSKLHVLTNAEETVLPAPVPGRVTGAKNGNVWNFKIASLQGEKRVRIGIKDAVGAVDSDSYVCSSSVIPSIEKLRHRCVADSREYLKKLCKDHGVIPPLMAWERWQSNCILFQQLKYRDRDDNDGEMEAITFESATNNYTRRYSTKDYSLDYIIPSDVTNLDEGLIQDLLRGGVEKKEDALKIASDMMSHSKQLVDKIQAYSRSCIVPPGDLKTSGNTKKQKQQQQERNQALTKVDLQPTIVNHKHTYDVYLGDKSKHVLKLNNAYYGKLRELYLLTKQLGHRQSNSQSSSLTDFVGSAGTVSNRSTVAGSLSNRSTVAGSAGSDAEDIISGEDDHSNAVTGDIGVSIKKTKANHDNNDDDEEENKLEGVEENDEEKEENKGENNGENKGNKGGNKNDDELTRSFHSALYSLLARYNALLGHGMQCALPEHVFQTLHDHVQTNFECFASPLNCRYSSYCSVFPDTDGVFGSKGSFFDFLPTTGSYEVNPPFIESIMTASVEHAQRLLDGSDGALSFVFIIPGWTESLAYQALITSPSLVYQLAIAAKDHGYCSGAQHQRKDRYLEAPYDTILFVLQNVQGRKQYGKSISSASGRGIFEKDLRASFSMAVPSEAMKQRRLKEGRGFGDLDGGGGVYKGKKDKAHKN